MTPEDVNLLQVRNLQKSFGGIQAVHQASFTVQRGRIKSLIGPNGAGKTTILNLLCGIYPSDGGEILFQGRNISRLPPHRITALGVGRTFQSGGLFPNMTLMENVLVGFHDQIRIGVAQAMLGLPWVQAEERKFRQRALELLEPFDLASKDHLLLANVSVKEQRMVEIASALAIRPDLLLLDEPSAGLNDTEAQGLGEALFKIRDGGVTILLVEHNMDLIMKVSDEIVVLNYGEILAEGSPGEIQKNEQVIRAYLGE